MDTHLVTQNYRLQNWTQLIEQRIHSGLTIQEWCDQNNVTKNQYVYWLRKVKSAALENAGFSEISIQPDRVSEESCIRIRINDALIEISPDSSDDLIRRVVSAVRHAK